MRLDTQDPSFRRDDKRGSWLSPDICLIFCDSQPLNTTKFDQTQQYMYNVHIAMKISFAWDDNKNRENVKKHGISFEEAVSIFQSIPFKVFYDTEHSDYEDRYVAVGLSNKGRVLVVVHIENELGTEIRIISARKATKKEKHTLLGRLQ